MTVLLPGAGHTESILADPNLYGKPVSDSLVKQFPGFTD